MRRTYLLSAAVALLLAAGLMAAPAAQAENAKDFIGLWEGMDLGDGSDATLSVRDLDHDGVLEISWRESSWSFCPDGSGNPSERAIITGTAIVSGDMITSPDATLVCLPPVAPKRLCFGFDDGFCDALAPALALLFDKDNGTLEEIGSGTVLHRISD